MFPTVVTKKNGNRIAQATSFQGAKLLNGNYDYTTSGVTSTSIDNVRINAARIPDGATVNVVVQVTASAQTGKLGYTGGAVTGATGVTIEIAGNSSLDCDGNGALDSCQLTANPALDCNGNSVLDSCDIAANSSLDCNTNAIIDTCEILT